MTLTSHSVTQMLPTERGDRSAGNNLIVWEAAACRRYCVESDRATLQPLR